jgi:TetR/AcrR family transcriptional regulator, ethionamide resistance regulator
VASKAPAQRYDRRVNLVWAENERPWSERARRSARASGDERERAIMRTAEELLETSPLSQISVDALARGAGLSRSAFYFYFPSKDAVVLALVERLVQEAGGALDDALERAGLGPDSWREGIAIFYEIFGAHRAVIQAAAELSESNEEAQGLWAQITAGWVDQVAGRIEEERENSLAPAGVSARALATALVQMNERTLRSVFTGVKPAIAEREVIDVLAHVWVSAIYAPAHTDPPTVVRGSARDARIGRG